MCIMNGSFVLFCYNSVSNIIMNKYIKETLLMLLLLLVLPLTII